MSGRFCYPGGMHLHWPGARASLACAFWLWVLSAPGHPLDVWHTRFAMIFGPPRISGLTYGGELFVAVGSGGLIITSPTGESWSQQLSRTTLELYDVCYGNGVFVAVGQAGGILSSSNGTNWTLCASRTNSVLHAVQFGNGVFVATGQGVLLTSPNGTDWALQHPEAAPFSYVSFGNGLFLRSWITGTNLVSLDGTNWFPRPSGSTNNLSLLAYAGGIFVSIDISNRVFASSDAVSWTPRGQITEQTPTALGYGNGYFVLPIQFFPIGSGAPFVQYARDLTNWSDSSQEGLSLNRIVFGRNTFVAINGGDYIVQSDPVFCLRQLAPRTLSIEASENQVYEVQLCPDLSPAQRAWTALTNITFQTSPFIWTDDVSSPGAQGFYRVLSKP